MIDVAPGIVLTKRGRPRKAHAFLVRQEITEWKCSKCGVAKPHHDLQVHHADGNPKNGDLQNLELVCRKCHRAAHRIIGPSVVPYLKAKTPYQLEKFINKFDEKMQSFGGYKKLISLTKKGKTLDAIGTHFGVTRERARQWIVGAGIHKTKAPDPWNHDNRYPYYEYRNREWYGNYLYALKRYIKSRNIAKYKLAEELGVKPGVVYLIFRNRKFLAPDVAKKLIEGSGGMLSHEDLYGKPA